ncbi:MAG: pyridoxamine 5'-phosphate oxidase family protein [Lachnospiraceae bacterium]|nr:pyridoxamine 5'-phosphate oxidase family protein [Lachnospiraceae bacterium]
MSSYLPFLAAFEPGSDTETVRQVLRRFSPLYAATTGLDGRPNVRPVHFAYEQDGAFYFLTLKSGRMYAELSAAPYVQLCAYDRETRTVFRMSGKVCFTEEPDVVGRGIEACPEILDAAGGDRKMPTAFFLTGADAVLESPDFGVPAHTFRLPEPEGVLIGITIRKKTELRDRLVRVFRRREAEPPALDGETAKLYDGALFVFAETAKKMWPRMDVQPLERAAVFETWDEREHFTRLAAKKIGNAVIASPEDITYWLNPETLTG